MTHTPRPMTRPTFIMLCGVSGSGKTTYSRKSVFDSYVKLNTDDYLMKMMDKEGITYGESFNSYILQAEFELIENLKAAVKSESNIILDQLNLTPAIRRKKLLRVPPEIYNRVAVSFDLDEKTLTERNNERAKKNMEIPDHALQIYIDRFTPPSTKEGFDEIWKKDEIRY